MLNDSLISAACEIRNSTTLPIGLTARPNDESYVVRQSKTILARSCEARLAAQRGKALKRLHGLRIPVSCLGARASRTLRYESTTGQIWRNRGRGKVLHA